MTKKSISDTLRRTCLILAGSLIMAVNLKSFVRTDRKSVGRERVC